MADNLLAIIEERIKKLETEHVEDINPLKDPHENMRRAVSYLLHDALLKELKSLREIAQAH